LFPPTFIHFLLGPLSPSPPRLVLPFSFPFCVIFPRRPDFASTPPSPAAPGFFFPAFLGSCLSLFWRPLGDEFLLASAVPFLLVFSFLVLKQPLFYPPNCRFASGTRVVRVVPFFPPLSRDLSPKAPVSLPFTQVPPPAVSNLIWSALSHFFVFFSRCADSLKLPSRGFPC